MQVILIIQGFRCTSSAPPERSHVGQLNSFTQFCWSPSAHNKHSLLLLAGFSVHHRCYLPLKYVMTINQT